MERLLLGAKLRSSSRMGMPNVATSKSEMVIRSPELDRDRYPHLPHLRYAFGGTMGTDVRDKVDKKTGKVTPHAKPHAGWDLYAKPGTQTFAITDGTIVATTDIHCYGHVVLLEFQFPERTLYALYAHLKEEGRFAAGTEVSEGDPVARTGVSGNASGEPPHLHFEIWTKRHVHRFPDGRISPGEVLGYLSVYKKQHRTSHPEQRSSASWEKLRSSSRRPWSKGMSWDRIC